MASAPKSNRAYAAFSKARADGETSPVEPVPLHLRNPVTKVMKDVGYGEGYEPYTKKSLLPKKLKGKKYYEKSD